HYPALNDCLASTVQFLEQTDDAQRFGSPSLRHQVISSALRQSRDCDFNQVVDTRGVRASGLSLAGSAGLAFALLLAYPSVVRTALARLANPFGDLAWPLQTQLVLENYRPRVARGEAYEIRCLVSGVMPDRAVIDCDGIPPARQFCPLTPGQE